MVIEIIVILILIFLGLTILKMEHHTRRVKLVILIIISFLIYTSIVSIFSSKKFDLSSPRGIVSAIYVYVGWLGQTAVNLWDVGTKTVHMVGNAIKFDNNKTKGG